MGIPPNNDNPATRSGVPIKKSQNFSPRLPKLFPIKKNSQNFPPRLPKLFPITKISQNIFPMLPKLLFEVFSKLFVWAYYAQIFVMGNCILWEVVCFRKEIVCKFIRGRQKLIYAYNRCPQNIHHEP